MTKSSHIVPLFQVSERPRNTQRYAKSGVMIAATGVSLTGKSLLSDVESLLSQPQYRKIVEDELQTLLQDLAQSILTKTIG